ncbi:FUSC family protein [Bhargavaea cecembensis]|uniref:FUSC family protein n=1 Tax=Bhargavaea cecembensis TaxID=394098 RepID=UPI000590C792|nr:aromatic acid exporter family protein [Bhargavaea cecembensis]
MKLGARILKTGVAIVLALFLAQSLQLPTPLFAGIAAIFAIQPSIYRSYRTIVQQVQGNIIGAVVAFIFALIFGDHLVGVGFAAVVIIAIMLRLKLENAITLALVMMIGIMELPDENFVMYAVLRFSTMLTGIFSAFLVNMLFLPPKYETKLFQSIQSTEDEIIRWTRLAGRQASEHSATQKALKKIDGHFKNIDTLYSLFKEERGYTKRFIYQKGRKLVIYRQMIQTAKSGHRVLKQLHLYENELISLPLHFRMMVQERLDDLLTYQEQILLKFAGKLKDERMARSGVEAALSRQEVMDIFVKEIAVTKEEEEFSAYHLLHLLSSILRYEEELEQLDRLIVGYVKRHGGEMDARLREDIF